ncbi:PilZ domain-containing protein [Methylobacterium nodulans]|uniref:Type IV pilus assembly PilZ n=1 Tax=Methylobacterium nodulans (strain LMG 21967 / CNCM I-2342 / ORS 2060) TaxID=460265 RepID=B8IUY3_METNO|nr:PilZ domain-containing protein [Methylobacterium nodulans]ACL59041.1 type IV pilus assembly PilZ [Methylobacterium nodulans ORS 2060]
MMQTSRAIPPPGTPPESPATVLRISGRYLLPNGHEHACETRTFSLTEAELIAAVPGLPGDPVTIYLNTIGAVTGVIRSLTPAGFIVAIEIGPGRRARIAARLAWLAARASGKIDQRSDVRIVPATKAVQVKLPDGSVLPGSLIDLSMTGAAIAVAARPAVGATVTVGKRFATVVRHLDGGIAVAFRLPFRPETFNESVVL